MITPRPLTGTFADNAYGFLTRLEADVPRVYTDSKGIPTLGVGYALLIEIDNNVTNTKEWVLRDNLTTDLSDIGVTLSQANIDLLDEVAVKLNDTTLTPADKTTAAQSLIPPYVIGETSSSVDVMGFTIDNTQSRQLFDKVMPEYVGILASNLDWAKFNTSNEGVALFSLAFNSDKGITKRKDGIYLCLYLFYITQSLPPAPSSVVAAAWQRCSILISPYTEAM